MRVLGLESSSIARPLQALEVVDAPGRVSVLDGAGNVIAKGRGPRLKFLAGGAAGTHRVLAMVRGQVVEELTFPMLPVTSIEDGSGRFEELFQLLVHSLHSFTETNSVLWRGKAYRFFVCWLRDHVHVLKGMKYLTGNLKGAIELYRDSQREDGMIWDNVYPRTRDGNYWDTRFAEGDFIRPFDDWSAEFKRIPVEADVEYLFVEGVYATWKATGDTAWMTSCLSAVRRALAYCTSDRLRWSTKYQLIKRGHTIDTWDFQCEEDCTIAGDAMRADPDKTRFGIMFGDNTGLAAAYSQLAEMLRATGEEAEAAACEAKGREVLDRLAEVSWLGSHYQHHVPEQDGLVRDLGVDPKAQVSLSNAYSLNRGIDLEKQRAIVATYQGIQRNLPSGSPGEWYTIFPPFERGYGGHNVKWQYMNGGVTPIVGGELARGAFFCGEEAYGAGILRRISDLARKHENRVMAVYTGAFPKAPPARFTPVDIRSVANLDTAGTSRGTTKGWTGEGDNDLAAFPSGEQTLGGIRWKLGDAETGRMGLGLSTREGYAASVSLPIRAKTPSLFLLHTAASTGHGGYTGTVTFRYEDGSSQAVPIVRGTHVLGWWLPDEPEQHGPKSLSVVWRGSNRHCNNVGVAALGIANPHPDRKIESLDFSAAPDGSLWMVLGVTLSSGEATFPAGPVSFGIPDNWATSAVIYALVEGLAGVVDRGVAFSQAEISPRWSAAGEKEAQVCIAYPESLGYAAYRIHHRARARCVELDVTGSGAAVVRVLVPGPATDAKVNGKPVEFTTETVGPSIYASVAVPPGVSKVRVGW